MLRKTVLATTMLGAGLAYTSGAAFADTTPDVTPDAPVANASHTQTITPTNICGNTLNIGAGDLGDTGGLLGGLGMPSMGGDEHHGDHGDHGKYCADDSHDGCTNVIKADNGGDDWGGDHGGHNWDNN